MRSKEFIEQLWKFQRTTRELLVVSGDPGCKAITKVSGIPWWPLDIPRPVCSQGHSMSFIAQFLLSDVPGFQAENDSLVSFHYCQQCSDDGDASWGCNCPLNKNGYNITIFNDVLHRKSDNLGIIAKEVIKPYSVTFRNKLEVPGFEDTTRIIGLPNLPEDYPQGNDDFDENIFPNLVHVSKSKLGGWPTWVQTSEPPKTQSHEQLYFLGQLDWMLCDNATWCLGGSAYLFLFGSETSIFRCDMVIQTT